MKSARLKALEKYRALTNEAKRKGQLIPVMRELALKDLYFLLINPLNQFHMIQGPEYKKDFLFDRCREVQAEPDGCLDLWAREHYKSTIITYGLTIQDILNNPELTIAIFSFNKTIARGFLNQIKREFEANEKLKGLFPHILWQNPETQSPK